MSQRCAHHQTALQLHAPFRRRWSNREASLDSAPHRRLPGRLVYMYAGVSAAIGKFDFGCVPSQP